MQIAGSNANTLHDAPPCDPPPEVDRLSSEARSWTRLDEGQTNALRSHFQIGLPLPPSSVREPTPYSPAINSAPFRFTDAFPLPPGLNTIGWSELCVSRSASLSRMDEVIEAHGGLIHTVTILDLQQESHAIVGGYPVSWDVKGEWTNIGMNAQAVTADEMQRIAALRSVACVTLTPRPSKKGGTPQAEHISAPLIYQEKEIVASFGARYERIPTPQRLAPRILEVDHFIALAQSLPATPRLHIHCRAGKGRTGIFLAMHDMLRNAQRVPLVELIERQRAFHPYPVFSEPSETGDIHDGYRNERFQFLRLFYEYARVNPMGEPQTWSAWLVMPAAV